jgi:ABC-type branched-subunit amino acid transport system substrate-binding protein
MGVIVALLAGAALLVGAAGCGSSNSSDTGSSSAGATASTAAASGDAIKIGTSIPLSGAIPLQSELDGYKQAVKEANDAGGVEIDGTKHPIELVALDNRSDNTLQTQQIRTLALKDKVSTMLGACCQQVILAGPQADALKIPLVSCCLPVELGAPSKGYNFIAFQKLADAAINFYKVADTATTNKKVVMVTNNDAPGKGTADLFTAVGKQSGYDVVASGSVPAGTTDFSDVINKAKSSDAQVLVAAMTPPDCFAMWKQMKALAYKPQVAVGLQCAQTPGWAKLGDLGNGTLVVLSWIKTAGLPGTDNLLATLGKKWPNPTDLQGAVSGYEAAQIAIDAIKRAKSDDPEAIKTALEQTDGSFALGPVKFDAKGQSVTPTFIGQWNDGDIDQVYPTGKGSTDLVAPTSGLQ